MSIKKIFTSLFFISAMCGFAFAQKTLPELEAAKRIKLLESTRKDVKKILAKYADKDDEDADWFEGEKADIDITYTDGDCSEEDSEELWNIAEGRVKLIEISLNDDGLTIEDFGYNRSNFTKEQEYSDVEGQFIYSNKKFGISFRVDEDGVQEIFLFPSKSYETMICSNETGKVFYSTESWFGNTKLEDRSGVVYCPPPPSVVKLALSVSEIIVNCRNTAEDKVCSSGNRKISVTATALDPENDVLTYEYTVSAGKIVGQGSEVIWDLSGVLLGEYTITAGVNDGCGICGQTKTEIVTIRECSDCSREK